MRKHFLLACLYFSALSVFAQSNFVPATLVRSGGEKMSGLIDYQQWSKNPKKISFKESDLAKPSIFTPEEVKSFEITGGDRYISARVSKDMRPVKLGDLNILTTDTLEQENAFLRELFSNDRIGLYILTDFKNHFYVREDDGKLVELIYRLIITVNSDQVEEQPVFRNQLAAYFPEAATSGSLITLKYNETSLTRFFYRATNTPQKSVAKPKPVFRVGSGVALSKMVVSGSSKLSDHDINASVTPLIYAGIDIPMSRGRGAFTLRSFAEFYQLNYESSYTRPSPPAGEEERYRLAINSFKLAFGALYNIYNADRHKFYLGGNVAVNFFKYRDNSFIRKDLNNGEIRKEQLYEFQSSWFTVNMDAGAVIFKQFEVSSSVRLLGSFSNIWRINVKPYQYLFRVGYRF